MSKKSKSVPFSKMSSNGTLLQVLELSEKSGGLSAQLDEVYHQSSVPSVSLHCGVCSAGDAALRRTVSIKSRRGQQFVT